MATNAECPLGKHLSVSNIGIGTLLVEDIEQYTIFGLAWHDDYILEILCSCTDKGDATDIYLLDDILIRSTTGNSGLKWIKVNNNQVDGWYLILCHLLLVAFIVATSKNTAKHFGVKGFYTTTENRRIRCHIFYLLALISE